MRRLTVVMSLEGTDHGTSDEMEEVAKILNRLSKQLNENKDQRAGLLRDSQERIVGRWDLHDSREYFGGDDDDCDIVPIGEAFTGPEVDEAKVRISRLEENEEVARWR